VRLNLKHPRFYSKDLLRERYVMLNGTPLLDPRPLAEPHPHLLPLLSSTMPPPLIQDPPGFDRQNILDPSFKFTPVLDRKSQMDVDAVTLKPGKARGVKDVASVESLCTRPERRWF
jgi:hypothetical protein